MIETEEDSSAEGEAKKDASSAGEEGTEQGESTTPQSEDGEEGETSATVTSEKEVRVPRGHLETLTAEQLEELDVDELKREIAAWEKKAKAMSPNMGAIAQYKYATSLPTCE